MNMKRKDQTRRRGVKNRRRMCEHLATGTMEPFVCERGDNRQAWQLLAPDWRDHLRLAWRYLLLTIADRIAISPVKIRLWRMVGVKIGRDVFISPGVVIDPLFPELIELEDGVLLGMGCRLIAHDVSAKKFRVGRIRIGQGAVIGAYGFVRCGVTVGAGATVGACSFVNRDVSDGQTVGGVPARCLKGEMNQAEIMP